jgi:hypothetical protein
MDSRGEKTKGAFMFNRALFQTLTLSAVASALLLGPTGCSNLPGTKGQQGAVVGGVGGAAAGAAIGGSEHRALGALIGGALGAGAGYVVGANVDKIKDHDRPGAEKATSTAQTAPATAEQARMAATADVNNDGFVTLDEVTAMRAAGLTDQQMLERLRATGHVFDLTAEQQRYLQDQGVSAYVVAQMAQINRDARDRLIGQYPSTTAPPVVSRPRGSP